MTNPTPAPKQTVTVHMEPAVSPASVTRGRCYADGERGGRADLSVARWSDTKWSVCWNVDRGRGWFKGWKATRASEAEAMAFAASKWERLVTWLEDLEPVERGNGAAAAFSAQVASMAR